MNINNVGYKIFKSKQGREHKAVDLSILQPSKKVFLPHEKSKLDFILMEAFFSVAIRVP